MRFAFLGADTDTLHLEQSLLRVGHETSRVSVTEWESLLARSELDAVVVSREGTELQREDQLRKLVGAGITVIASHPAADVLTAYELEMIRREAGGILLPYLPAASHPFWSDVIQARSDSAGAGLGRLEQILWDRTVSDRRADPVAAQLAQDISHLRRLLGTISSVNAVGTMRDDGSWSNLTVHFGSESGTTATWSFTPSGTGGAARVQFIGESDRQTLDIPADTSAPWQVQDGGGSTRLLAAWTPADELLAQLSATREGHAAKLDWNSACVDLEIADTANKSWRRKRSIDLFTSGRTEERTFKGFMAAAGCLILLAILAVFLVLALWDGFRAPFREPIPVGASALNDGAPPVHDWPLWVRMWPVYPLFGFLILQFLVFVARPSREGDHPGTASDES